MDWPDAIINISTQMWAHALLQLARTLTQLCTALEARCVAMQCSQRKVLHWASSENDMLGGFLVVQNFLKVEHLLSFWTLTCWGFAKRSWWIFWAQVAEEWFEESMFNKSYIKRWTTSVYDSISENERVRSKLVGHDSENLHSARKRSSVWKFQG